MTASRRPVLLLIVLALLAPAATALAQMQAQDRPTVRGSLHQEIKHCRSRRIRVQDRVIAVASSCIRFYKLSFRAEADERRNYGGIWLQATVDARRRWCTTTVKSDIDLPPGTAMHARAPKSRSTPDRKRVRTKLIVDARRQADTTSVIKQSYVLLPRALRTGRRSEGAIWRAAWRGSTRSAFAVASGIEVSWPAGEAPTKVTSTLRYELRKRRRC